MVSNSIPAWTTYYYNPAYLARVPEDNPPPLEETYESIIVGNVINWLHDIDLKIPFSRESSICSFLDYYNNDLCVEYVYYTTLKNKQLTDADPLLILFCKAYERVKKRIVDFSDLIYQYEMGVNAPSFSKWQYEYDHLISLNHETNKEVWERNVNMMVLYDAKQYVEKYVSRGRFYWLELTEEFGQIPLKCNSISQIESRFHWDEFCNF